MQVPAACMRIAGTAHARCCRRACTAKPLASPVPAPCTQSAAPCPHGAGAPHAPRCPLTASCLAPCGLFPSACLAPRCHRAARGVRASVRPAFARAPIRWSVACAVRHGACPLHARCLRAARTVQASGSTVQAHCMHRECTAPARRRRSASFCSVQARCIIAQSSCLFRSSVVHAWRVSGSALCLHVACPATPCACDSRSRGIPRAATLQARCCGLHAIRLHIACAAPAYCGGGVAFVGPPC